MKIKIMRSYVPLSFALLIFCVLLPLDGSSQDFRFKHITSNDGLSQNTVMAITQDGDGFMWFGTKDGLNKYDGYSFAVYQNVPNDPKTIDSNYITALFTDSRGNLWVGTDNGLLNLYDKQNDNFQRISLPFSNSEGRNNYEIKDIAEGKNGTIWVGTRDYGVFKVPVSNNVVQEKLIKQYHNAEKGATKLTHNIIRELYEDKNEILWIATNNGLTRMDVKKETFTPFYFNIKDTKAPKNVLDGAITSIYGTDDGYLWLGSLSGLIKFNTRDYSYKFFPHQYTVNRYGWGEIIEIVEDHKKNLWLAAAGGLMYYDTEKKDYSYFKNDPYRPESVSYNSISGLYKDRTNIIWIGTVGMGIDYYDPKSHRFSLLKRPPDKTSRIAGFSLRSILEENDRYVWVSGEVLYRWDRQTNTLKSYETSSKRVDDFGNTGPYAMVKSQDGDLWSATSEGLFVYDPKLEKARQFKFDKAKPDGIPQKNVFTVYEDREGQLWIVTENFLSKMTDKKNGLFKHYRYVSDPEYYLYMRPVLFDDGQKLWLGTKKGLLAFDKKKESFHTYINDPSNPESLTNNHIKSICPDPDNPDKFLWIGTSGGLEKFDKAKGSFTHFTEKDGLPNNVIYGILSDHQHKLWLSTNKGISRFNPRDLSFRNFEINDGLQNNEFNTGAYFKSDKGELFFGGIDGLNYFFPEQIRDNPFIPPIALTGIRVYNGSKKDDQKNSFISIPVHDKNAMTFSSKDYIIWLKFAALDFSTSEKNHYAYKLEGFHDDWIYIQNSRNVSFTHLPPGKYVFKLKASNNDGVWNEAGISIPMRIMPHWALSWWAYCLYFLMLMVLLYYFRRYEINRILVKNQLEVERIEKDTLRELDLLKTQFFTNISHEFRTPLTLISGQAESLLRDLKAEKNREQIRNIGHHSHKMLLLINQLLDIAKLEAGKWKLESRQSNLVLYLKNLLFSFESMADRKKIDLKFRSEDDDIQALFDNEKMEKIIGNLISNALKFTPEKGTITLHVERIDVSKLRISITDTGIGISEKDLPFIFDRFYQADKSDTRAFEGTGIGLALVKELVDLHRGTISVVSNDQINGKTGTTFTIEIPIGPVETDKPQEPIPALTKNEIPEDAGVDSIAAKAELPGQKIVLLIEDNADIRKFITEQLEDQYKVFTASNGKEGIEYAQKYVPDLIITDVMMPEMDGITMVKILRKDEMTSHIPIIMLTGKVTQEDKMEGLEAGVDAYLTKPFSVSELELRISNLISQREQLRLKYSHAFIVDPKDTILTDIDQQFLENTHNSIKENLKNVSFGVEQLAENMNLSASQLHRKLEALIDHTPGQLIRNMRLQKAAELISQNAGNIAEICFLTGFNDQTYFSRAFKQQFGCSPSSYKKKSH